MAQIQNVPEECDICREKPRGTTCALVRRKLALLTPQLCRQPECVPHPTLPGEACLAGLHLTHADRL